ncbi:MAG: hypothetical protein JKY95_14225 [Planctomycetaceae bacterium]|nr:hypothetical protein [Planctomycetaceae bacterium]
MNRKNELVTASHPQVILDEHADYHLKIPAFFACAIVVVVGCSIYSYASQLKQSANHSLVKKTTRSRICHQVMVSSLECRRYEKDYFLNIQDEGSRDKYLLKWRSSCDTCKQRPENVAPSGEW